jgi:hypothetical protein
MANLIRKKQVDQTEFSGFFVNVGDSNYYPLPTNPSGYATTTELSTSTGELYTDIQGASGVLNSAIAQTGVAANSYTNSVSGDISTRLESTGSLLNTDTNNLSGYVGTTSGNLNTTINTSSGTLNTKINSTSGDLTAYTNTVSGNLSTEIANSSSSTVVNNIVSGNDFAFTGDKVFRSEVTASIINVSGSNVPTDISLTAGSGIVSVVGSNGTFMSFVETGVGSNSSSLFAVNDAAGLAYLEMFDNTTLVLGRNASQAVVISGTNGTVIMPNLPTSSAGLPAGALYNSGGTLKIV